MRDPTPTTRRPSPSISLPLIRAADSHRLLMRGAPVFPSPKDDAPDQSLTPGATSHLSRQSRPSCSRPGGGVGGAGLQRLSTRSAVWAGSSCSQERMTIQPTALRRWSVSASRALFTAILAGQYQPLAVDLGLPCSRQPRQKQPSTYTATRAGPKTMSARRRRPGRGARSTR